MAMAANRAGIVHHAGIVRRVVVHVVTIAVLVAVVKAGDPKDGMKAGQVVAPVDVPLKGSLKSN
jgi:hypothetical protein